MGRFGNQAEQLLGSLQFAHHLNRTLVLPPFIKYNYHDIEFIPFQDIFDVDAIREYTDVITLEDFMATVAPDLWSPSQRKIFCFASRLGPQKGCNPLDGNPFGPFWRHINVTDFPTSVFHSPLQTHYLQADDWSERFKDEPVLAFVGAPSSFPVNDEATLLQKYVRWSPSAINAGRSYKEFRSFSNTSYVGVHIRHASDWKNACSLLEEHRMHQLFSSRQCTTGKKIDGLSYSLCLPNLDKIALDIARILRESNANVVYIATDKDEYEDWTNLYRILSKTSSNLVMITPSWTFSTSFPTGKAVDKSPTLIQDLVILTESDHFIGNCISSFTGVVTRSRKWQGSPSPTTFFAEDGLVSVDHDEF